MHISPIQSPFLYVTQLPILSTCPLQVRCGLICTIINHNHHYKGFQKPSIDNFIQQRMITLEMTIFIWFIVGNLYVTGGTVGDMFDHISSSRVDVVDVISGDASRGPSMRHRHRCHAIAVSATSLFVFGSLCDIEDSCEVFSPQARR